MSYGQCFIRQTTPHFNSWTGIKPFWNVLKTFFKVGLLLEIAALLAIYAKCCKSNLKLSIKHVYSLTRRHPLIFQPNPCYMNNAHNKQENSFCSIFYDQPPQKQTLKPANEILSNNPEGFYGSCIHGKIRNPKSSKFLFGKGKMKAAGSGNSSVCLHCKHYW